MDVRMLGDGRPFVLEIIDAKVSLPEGVCEVSPVFFLATLFVQSPVIVPWLSFCRPSKRTSTHPQT